MKNPEKIIIISDTVKETDEGNRISGVRDDRGKLLEAAWWLPSLQKDSSDEI